MIDPIPTIPAYEHSDPRNKRSPLDDSDKLPDTRGAKNPLIQISDIDLLKNPMISPQSAYTVATLPAPATYGKGFALATDLTNKALTGSGLAPTGSGSDTAPVYSDGTQWNLLAGPIKTYTVAGLPSAASYGIGFAFVSDATLNVITGLGTTPLGGGTNKVPVYSDGTSWYIL